MYFKAAILALLCLGTLANLDYGYTVKQVCVSRYLCGKHGGQLDGIKLIHNCICDRNWCGDRCEKRCGRHGRSVNYPLEKENQFWKADELCENVSCENGKVRIVSVLPRCEGY